jgi:YesN/AraC family two-component response regulator
MKLKILVVDLKFKDIDELKKELILDYADVVYEKSLFKVVGIPNISSYNIIIISDYFGEATTRYLNLMKKINPEYKILVLSYKDTIDDDIFSNFISNGADSYFSSVEDMKDRIYNIYLDLISSDNEFTWSDCTKKTIKYIKPNYNKLNDNFLEKISLNVKYSTSCISHSVKKDTGKSVKEWLISIKSEKAVELLTTTNHQIKYISNLLGYKSVQGFIKSLKKKTGKTPVEFRKEKIKS